MTTVTEAIQMISALSSKPGFEFISLDDASGRYLAENIYADRDYPPFNRAAMDGYAIMMGDWELGIRTFKVVEVIYAGVAATQQLTSGTCYKIMTGAATPIQADAIIKVEDSHAEAGQVSFQSVTVHKFLNIARKAEDKRSGDLIIELGKRCTPQIISLLASVGKKEIKVYQLPKIALITTGNEVVKPEDEAMDFQIRNSNQYLLRALLKTWNISPKFCRHVADDRRELKHCLQQALTNDIIIINGGISAGDADYVPLVLEELGVKLLVQQVAMKPGKPICIGITATGAIVFALPGNPLSCLVTFSIFVESYLSTCINGSSRTRYQLPLLQQRTKKTKLTEYFPVRINKEKYGINITAFNGSGDITAGVYADGIACQEADIMELNAGQFIQFYPFRNALE